MKKFLFLVLFLVSFSTQAQVETGENITLTQKQDDDVYLAGESVTIDAQVHGDVVTAGNSIYIKDSIYQDLIVAGGTINVDAPVKDDIRAAGGKLIIDTTVGDDVVIFGGEVMITKDAIINGNLIAFSGDITMNGTVMKDMRTYSGGLDINGEIHGATKIIAESIDIGDAAKFYGDVEYWSESGNVDFKNSVQNGKAYFNASLNENGHDFPWSFFGFAAIGIWIFYLLSAFLIILILNTLFKAFFSKTAQHLDQHTLKTFLYGLIYLVGVPVAIVFTFIVVIGIPIGLLLFVLYIFSLIIGHLVAAVLLAHYINQKNKNDWGIWILSLLAVGLAAVLRIITITPFVGFLISIVLIAMAYGLIAITLLQRKGDAKLLA